MASAARFLVLCLALVALTASGAQAAFNSTQWKQRTRPYVIANRGSPAYAPEHTMLSTRISVFGDADMVQCDVVLTKDLVPVCRLEPMLDDTSDAKTKFPDMIKNYTIDGQEYEDVFAIDLTLEQLKTLGAKQRYSFRPLALNYKLKILTLEEQLEHVTRLGRNTNRICGAFVTLRYSSWHNSRPEVQAAGTTIQDIVLKLLTQYNYTGPMNSEAWQKQPVFISSFEQDDLVDLSKKTCIPLVQMLDGPDYTTPDRNKNFDAMIADASLDEIATYAAAAGPWKATIVDNDAGKPVSSGLIEKLHDRGLLVFTHTIRPEPQYINTLFGNGNLTAFAEWEWMFQTMGVDGALADASNVLQSYFEIYRLSDIGYVFPAENQARWNKVVTCTVA